MVEMSWFPAIHQASSMIFLNVFLVTWTAAAYLRCQCTSSRQLPTAVWHILTSTPNGLSLDYLLTSWLSSLYFHEQIFTLRQIIEKSLKYETPMLINFVDFKKAFDSVYRESLWKIMKSYGIPQWIIDIIRNFYDGSRCAVRHGGDVGEWFQIITGVRQGCVLSPLIFALVVDWVMTRVMSGKDAGMRWVNGGRLGDLDFADEVSPCWKMPGSI